MISNQHFFLKQIPHGEFCGKTEQMLVDGTKFQRPKYNKYGFGVNLNHKNSKQINITCNY